MNNCLLIWHCHSDNNSFFLFIFTFSLWCSFCYDLCAKSSVHWFITSFILVLCSVLLHPTKSSGPKQIGGRNFWGNRESDTAAVVFLRLPHWALICREGDWGKAAADLAACDDGSLEWSGAHWGQVKAHAMVPLFLLDWILWSVLVSFFDAALEYWFIGSILCFPCFCRSNMSPKILKASFFLSRAVLTPVTRQRSYGNVPQSHAILYYQLRKN
jgi:hypothetical protein